MHLDEAKKKRYANIYASSAIFISFKSSQKKIFLNDLFIFFASLHVALYIFYAKSGDCNFIRQIETCTRTRESSTMLHLNKWKHVQCKYFSVHSNFIFFYYCRHYWGTLAILHHQLNQRLCYWYVKCKSRNHFSSA